MKLVYDISMTIEADMTVYKNRTEKRPKIEVAQDFTNSSVYESVVTFNCHTGTHIDSPLHVIPNGKKLDSINLQNLITHCLVIDLTDVPDGVEVKHLEQYDIKDGEFIILKTRTSLSEEFLMDFPYLTHEAALWLTEKKIIGVGIDSLGIERSQPGHITHNTLLSNGIVILEGLRLKDVKPGEYTLIALPIKLDSCEAAPVRAVLCEVI